VDPHKCSQQITTEPTEVQLEFVAKTEQQALEFTSARIHYAKNSTGYT